MKVVDFGLARALDATRLTRSGQTLGTPAYMSPEQADARPLDRPSDIYSAAVLLYELLSGAPPFKADSPLAVLRQHVEAPPPPIAVALPRGLEGVIRRALAKDPAARFASAAEFAAALGALEMAPAGRAALAELAGAAVEGRLLEIDGREARLRLEDGTVRAVPRAEIAAIRWPLLASRAACEGEPAHRPLTY